MFRQKKIMAILCALLMVSALFLVPFESKASDYTYYKDFAEPATSDSQGYISLLWLDVNYNYYVTTYFWSCNGASDGKTSPCVAYITIDSTQIIFNVMGNDLVDSAMYSLYEIDRYDKYHFRQYSFDSTYTYMYGSSGLRCVGWKAKGNIGAVNTYAGFVNNDFEVFYSTDGSAMLLMNVYKVLQSSNVINDNIRTAVTSILNSVDGVENQLTSVINYLKSVDDQLTDIQIELQEIYDKLDDLLEEQKQSNTWLEKIFNYLEEKNEKDKQEAQTQGNNSTSQGMGAIEDKGGDFAGSLGGLTSSMSYTGTECAWEFPEVKLPAIPGVMDEVVLIRKQPIDFAVWVSAIPSGVLLVIQSLLTIGLIVYCFKELYSTIAYVLTLRKDDNS